MSILAIFSILMTHISTILSYFVQIASLLPSLSTGYLSLWFANHIIFLNFGGDTYDLGIRRYLNGLRSWKYLTFCAYVPNLRGLLLRKTVFRSSISIRKRSQSNMRATLRCRFSVYISYCSYARVKILRRLCSNQLFQMTAKRASLNCAEPLRNITAVNISIFVLTVVF